MTYNYTTLKSALAEELVVQETQPEYIAILPTIITYAEQRMYRELDLLDTVTRQLATLSLGNRNLTLPQTSGRFVTTQGVNVVTPSSQSVPDSGTRNQCLPASRDYLDAIWPSATGSSVPKFYAMITDQTLIFGPWPDANYTVEVIGTIRPEPLSETNPTTYLSLYLPDAFFAACMISGTGWQKNYGAQVDDPQAAGSWESQYQKLIGSANIEEQRKRYASGAWSSMSPTPIATATRP